MELENIVCAFVNIKSKELHIKFKDVYLLNKREKLIIFIKQEFGEFDIDYCSNVFTKHSFLCETYKIIINLVLPILFGILSYVIVENIIVLLLLQILF